MQLGMIGLGRMGGNMVRRLMRGGHDCVVFDRSADAVRALAGEGASGAASLDAFVKTLAKPRAIWLMVPAAVVDAAIADLEPLLERGDIIIDGGNTHYRDDVDRAKRLSTSGLHYVDCGTSGGVWGLERGYCLMIGGESDIVRHLDPIFATLAPGPPEESEASRAPQGGRAGVGPREQVRESPGSIARTAPDTPMTSTAERGYLHCGPSGAGHFVKMVHNGIEYGLMAAYAEGFNVLKHANVGAPASAEATAGKREADAETAPLRHPEYYQYDFNLGEIAEVWRRGSVIASWLLDLTASALHERPDLDGFGGRVSDSGEGRWTIEAAIDEGVPVDVLAASLFARFSSRGQSDFQNRLLSAMRFAFGGHVEKK